MKVFHKAEREEKRGRKSGSRWCGEEGVPATKLNKGGKRTRVTFLVNLPGKVLLKERTIGL